MQHYIANVLSVRKQKGISLFCKRTHQNDLNFLILYDRNIYFKNARRFVTFEQIKVPGQTQN